MGAKRQAKQPLRYTPKKPKPAIPFKVYDPDEADGLAVIDRATDEEISKEFPVTTRTEILRADKPEAIAYSPDVLRNLPDESLNRLTIQAERVSREDLLEALRVLKPTGYLEMKGKENESTNQ